MCRVTGLPFFHDVAPARRERGDLLHVHVGDGAGRRPAVLFVHGGPIPEGHSPRDSEIFLGYGALAAASGLVGITFDHRLHSEAHYPRAADDVAAAVEQARGLDVVDPDRLVLWFFSGGGALAASWLRAAPAWLRGIAWTYPVLAPPPDWSGDGPRFDCVAAVAAHPELPTLLVRVGDELPFVRPSQEAFVAAAGEAGAALDVVDVPGAPHGFEGQPHDADRRAAVDRAMGWVAARLAG